MNHLIALSIAVLALAPACINDQAGKFDAYVERSEPFRATVDTEVCEGRVDISGDYLIAVSTHLKRDTPLVLDATFSVDTTAWTVSCDFHLVDLSVDAQDPMADVGELYSATSPIAEDGSFSLDFGTIDVLATSNPITFSDIQAELVLQGCTKRDDFACGAVEGKVVTPEIDLATSTWAASKIDSAITDTPVVLDCSGTTAQ